MHAPDVHISAAYLQGTAMAARAKHQLPGQGFTNQECSDIRDACDPLLSRLSHTPDADEPTPGGRPDFRSEAPAQRTCQVLTAAAASSEAGRYTHAEKVSIRVAVIQMLHVVTVVPEPPTTSRFQPAGGTAMSA